MSNILPPPQLADLAEVERSAFNAAFYELGLRWHWDSETYEALASNPCERSRVRRYLETAQAHLLRAYEPEFLTDAILTTKDRCRRAIGHRPAHVAPSFNWADARWGEVGI